MTQSILRAPGLRALVVMTCTGFSGFAVLLPVAPLWAVHGGADEAGAGLVNGVLLLFTVLTQLLVPLSLRRFGWGPVLTVGMLLLGVPAVLYGLSSALGPVLVFSAVRGIGFGVLTVAGSAAVATLVEPGRRGEAIGTYGLAVALPNLVLLPAGPWIAENLGFWLIFVVSALPLAGIPAALRLASTVHATAPDLLHLRDGHAATQPAAEPDRTAYRRLLRPTLLLLAVTAAAGAVLTFAPQMVSSAGLTAAGMLVMGLVAALGRWRVGLLADRYGPERFLTPLIIVAAAGTALAAWSVTDPEQTKAVAFVAAMVVVGLGYGALQNLTLVVAFRSVSRAHHNRASAVWNVGFDAGTAAGSVGVGAMAASTGFAPALAVMAGLVVTVIPAALVRPRKQLRSDPPVRSDP